VQIALNANIMKNVILPTDLSVQSLWPIHQIVKEAKGQKLCIQIVHMIELPTSITDLIFSSRNKPYHAVPATFKEAYQMLSQKYKSSIEKIYFELVYCSTSRYLKNYLEGQKIDEVYMLRNYNYLQPLPQSVKFTSFFDKCEIPVFRVQLNTEASGFQSLSVLLNGKEYNKVSAGNRIAEPSVNYF
jgi:hypothetical protein